MKSFNTLLSALILCAIFQFSAQAQTTKTFIQEVGGLWSAGGHWSPPGVPTSSDNVLIPSDTALDVDINAFAASITIEADAEMDIDANLTVGGGTFLAGSTIDWVTGTITVNASQPLTVQGQLNVTSNLPKTLQGSSGSSLRIESEMNIVDAVGDLGFSSSAILQIAPGGVLNINGDITMFNVAFGPQYIENFGTINKTSGTGAIQMNNVGYRANGGILNLDSGSMNINDVSGNHFMDAVFNIQANGSFSFNNSNNNIFSGLITGQLDGPFIINAGSRTENVDAILNFSGSAGVVWAGGSIGSIGGSKLINNGLINVTGTGNFVNQVNGGTVRNEGQFIINENVDFDLRNGSVFENAPSGTMTVFDGTNPLTAESSILINEGLIQKTEGSGTALFQTVIDNINPGTIAIETGNIVFTTTFTGDGLITGAGEFATDSSNDLSATLAPGNNGIGTLTYNNVTEFDSTTACVYQLELNGTTPDAEHDVFAINADAKLNGTFDIQLGFAPQLNDEFVVITATEITDCNLPAQVTTTHTDDTYTFDVICNTNNVTLRVSDVVLTTSANILSAATAFPNPSNGSFKINLGENISEIHTTVTNILGQVVAFERFANTDTLKINIQGSPGIYFVKLSDNEGRAQTIKIIKY